MTRRVSIVGSVLLLFHPVYAFSQPGGPERPVAPRFARAVIFEQKNFGGRSMPLAIGEHRLADWKPASIKVPAGLAAYLYQSVDAAGGYGVSVDLLEDHADLAEFGLAGNVSLVNVFDATRGGQYFWARGSRPNANEFVPGHWERKRAAGNPINRVAVASPPLPSRAPAAPTAIERQGTRWVITTLGPQSSADDARWTSANATMGVIGSDFRGPQEIGSAKFQRASHNRAIPDWLNFWFPNRQPNDHRRIVYFKRTLTGVITPKLTKNWSGPNGNLGPDAFDVGRSGTYDLSNVPRVDTIYGTYPDRDVNIDVAPFVDYMYLIRDSHPPERSTDKRLKDLVDSDHDPCTDPFVKVEGEIDAGSPANEKLVTSLLPRVGKPIAMYGPWIYDIGHCDHPEIHPAEQIWWTENAPNNGTVYHLNVFADASKRFWWRDQMDDGTKLHPWGAPPITGLFAIAFEVPIDATNVLAESVKRFEVANVDVWNVATAGNPDANYDLVYGGKALVSFVPHNDAFNVSYENVGLKPGTSNVLRGFLVIETTVGTVKQIATRGMIIGTNPVVDVPQGAHPDSIDQRLERQIFEKKDGHYMFTITRTESARPSVLR